MVAVILLAAVVGGYRLRLNSVEARNRELQARIEQRTAELQQETQQRLQIQEALRQSETEKAVAAERSRLARDLHDVVSQTLFSAGLVAEALPSAWKRDPEEGQRLLQELRLLTQGALAEMRTLLMELRPVALLETSLGDLLRQLAEAASGREGIPVQVSTENHCKLPADVHIAFYRIAQEALNNVAKHARARQVAVNLHCTLHDAGGEQVELSVSDDGRGFDPARVPPDHLGLGIMRERAESVGATLAVQSSPGQGTRITVVWSDKVT
jgi:signal transduction histidine kinase